MIKVSVVMLTYNQEPFIAQAIEGVLMQITNFDIELLIGEDCSIDGTRSIVSQYVQKYPELIKAQLPEHNRGMNSNFSSLYNACNGKYIAHCEGDDYWTDPYKLQKQVDFLEANNDYAICFHNVNIEKDNEIIPDYITGNVFETTDITELAKGNYIHTPSVVYRRNLERCPEWFTQCSASDYALHLINAQYGKIKKINDVMAVYRVHAGGVHSMLAQTRKTEMWTEQLKIMIPHFDGEAHIALKQTLSKYLYSIINDTSYPIEIRNKYINDIAVLFPESILAIIESNKQLLLDLSSAKRALKTLLARFPFVKSFLK